MWVQTLDVSFGDLEPEISWSKGGPGTSTGGPPLEAVWRPLLTWRRVVRTIVPVKMGKGRWPCLQNMSTKSILDVRQVPDRDARA